MRRSVTVSGWKTPPAENALTVTSGPSTSASTSAQPARDSATASSTAAASSDASRTSVRPFWPWRSGGLTTQGTGIPAASVVIRHSGCGTPASLSRSRWRCLETASDAVSGESGCGRPKRAATRAAMATGQSIPGAMTPSMPSASASFPIAGSSSADTIARLSAYSKPGACASRSQATMKSPRSRAARKSPSCAGPAPRTRRRRGVRPVAFSRVWRSGTKSGRTRSPHAGKA